MNLSCVLDDSFGMRCFDVFCDPIAIDDVGYAASAVDAIVAVLFGFGFLRIAAWTVPSGGILARRFLSFFVCAYYLCGLTFSFLRHPKESVCFGVAAGCLGGFLSRIGFMKERRKCRIEITSRKSFSNADMNASV
jgi:hypothetical protein